MIAGNAAVCGFQRQHFWRHAEAFLDEMSRRKLELIGTSFDAAVGAFGSHAWPKARINECTWWD